MEFGLFYEECKRMTTFISTVEACIDTHSMLAFGTKVIIAVSGGADSMALLSVLYQLRSVYSLTLVVVHVNHLMRGTESFRDAMFVKQWAEKLRLPFYHMQADVKSFQRMTGLSPQHAARLLRYDRLCSLCRMLDITHVALGHTADDQVETFLVRLLRGSGPAGLVGIPSVRRPFIRPLITTHRPAILSYLTAEGISWVEDSTNTQRTYLRNRIRLDVLPMLQQVNPQVSNRLVELTSMFSAENTLLKQQTDALMQQAVHWKAGKRATIGRDIYQAAPLALQRRLLRCIVDTLLPLSSSANFSHIELLRQFVIDGTVGKRLELPGGVVAECQINHVLIWNFKHFSLAALTVVMPVPGVVRISELGACLIAEVCEKTVCKMEKMPGRAYLAMERLRFPLEIRFARKGDRFYPLGAPGVKKLKDFFIDSKVARAERVCIPLVVSGIDIVWVAGYRIAEPFKVSSDTQYILSLQYTVNETDTPCMPRNE